MTRQSASIKKYVKEIVSMVLNEAVDQHNFPFLRQPVDHPTRRIGDFDESTPLSDDPSLRQNVLQLLVRLKRVAAAGALQNASENVRTCARVADRTYPFYRMLFGFTEAEVNEASKADSGAGLHGSELSTVFPETEAGTQFLTDIGRRQLLSGFKKSAQADAQYYGDPRFRPIASDEVVWAVRMAFRASRWWEQQYGIWHDLRWVAKTSVIGPFVFTTVILLFAFLIWLLL
jgi:hypothetical protein